MRSPPIPIALVVAAVLAGCGGGDSAEQGSAKVPGGGDSADVEVIDAWADALRSGDVEKAASYFELPSLAENGTPPLKLDTRAKALAFNKSLPCGAKLTRATSAGRFTTATFTLTDRPGGGCGPGTGGTARTTFVIEDGKITEWRRVADEPETPLGGQAI
ncbi:MAG: hypothetical protein ACXWES_03865 [Solirubrobacterales bacterium]